MRRVQRLGAALAALVVLTASASATLAADAPWTETRVRAAWQGGASARGAIRPRAIVTIQNAPSVVQITWSSWGLTRATGRGFLRRCGGCVGDHGETVRITLSHPREYFCGDEPESIGHWFTRARLQSPHTNKSYGIIDGGHPNAC